MANEQNMLTTSDLCKLLLPDSYYWTRSSSKGERPDTPSVDTRAEALPL